MKHRLNSLSPPPAFKLRRLEQGSSTTGHESNSVCTLFDLSARVVAESLPFEYVEKTLVHVPEPVQEKIIYHSFPRRDSDIYTYASFHSKSDKGREKIPYYEGLDYFQNDCVENVIQIGMFWRVVWAIHTRFSSYRFGKAASMCFFRFWKTEVRSVHHIWQVYLINHHSLFQVQNNISLLWLWKQRSFMVPPCRRPRSLPNSSATFGRLSIPYIRLV